MHKRLVVPVRMILKIGVGASWLFVAMMFAMSGCSNAEETDGVDIPDASTPLPEGIVISVVVPHEVASGHEVHMHVNVSQAAGHYAAEWSQLVGETVTIVDADTVNASFTAPTVDEVTVLDFKVVVTDVLDQSAEHEVEVRVLPTTVVTTPDPPAASAGLDQDAHGCHTVSLHALGVGGSGGYSFSWTQTAGHTVTLSDPDIANPTFTAPSITASDDLVFEVTVTDSNTESDTDDVTIHVPGLEAGQFSQCERTVFACDKYLPADTCQANQKQVTCDQATPFAGWYYEISSDTAIPYKMFKTCISQDSCYKAWLIHSKLNNAVPSCTQLLNGEEPTPPNAGYDPCYFCCLGEDCNEAKYPEEDKLRDCSGPDGCL